MLKLAGASTSRSREGGAPKSLWFVCVCLQPPLWFVCASPFIAKGWRCIVVIVKVKVTQGEMRKGEVRLRLPRLACSPGQRVAIPDPLVGPSGLGIVLCPEKCNDDVVDCWLPYLTEEVFVSSSQASTGRAACAHTWSVRAVPSDRASGSDDVLLNLIAGKRCGVRHDRARLSPTAMSDTAIPLA